MDCSWQLVFDFQMVVRICQVATDQNRCAEVCGAVHRHGVTELRGPQRVGHASHHTARTGEATVSRAAGRGPRLVSAADSMTTHTRRLGFNGNTRDSLAQDRDSASCSPVSDDRCRDFHEIGAIPRPEPTGAGLGQVSAHLAGERRCRSLRPDVSFPGRSTPILREAARPRRPPRRDRAS
jgi:hypothetical protein